jgi:hypothetical protein
MAKKLTALKAIRAKCLDCSGGNRAEVRDCPATNCTLWPFRMGHSPKPRTKEKRLQETGSFFCYNPCDSINTLNWGLSAPNKSG